MISVPNVCVPPLFWRAVTVFSRHGRCPRTPGPEASFTELSPRWGAGAVRIFVFVTPMVLRPSEIPAKTEKTHRDRQEKYICSYLETWPLRPLTKNTQKSSKFSKIIEISRVYNFSTACSIRDPINTFLGVPGRHRPSWIGGSSTKIDEITIFFW